MPKPPCSLYGHKFEANDDNIYACKQCGLPMFALDVMVPNQRNGTDACITCIWCSNSFCVLVGKKMPHYATCDWYNIVVEEP